MKLDCVIFMVLLFLLGNVSGVIGVVAMESWSAPMEKEKWDVYKSLKQ